MKGSKGSSDHPLEEIIQRMGDVKYVISCFTDLLGGLRGRTLSLPRASRALIEGVGFDGSSIPGYTSIEESDIVMKPDLSTLTRLPDYFYDRPTAMVLCDIHEPNGRAFSRDSRTICRSKANELEEQGFIPTVAAEVEFYLAKEHGPSEVRPIEDHVKDERRYFDISPGRDLTELFRMDMCDILSKMGIVVEREQHEVGSAQNEVNFEHSTPLITSDNVVRYKFVAKALARKKYGCIATFMPKPWVNRPGSGMHVHVGLFKSDGKNLFYDPDDSLGISQLCRYFIGGLLDHARALCAIVAPTVNSYKRLMPGFEAPTCITWGYRNRSTLVRIPGYFLRKEGEARVELRCPDPLCNPYLAYVVIFEAGMDGIKKKIDPGDSVQENVYHMDESKRKELGIYNLPTTLKEALDEWKNDDICIRALGREVADEYLKLKYEEWKEYEGGVNSKDKLSVTSWELRSYLLM